MAFNSTKETPRGLVNLRSSKKSDKTFCANCKCDRFGPCGCTKKGEKKSKAS